ncbi:MAG: CDP-alcohol phosphatidyltransferase family protein [Desulforhopalus sp.]
MSHPSDRISLVDPPGVLWRLRRQALFSTLLFFSTWLLTLYLCWPVFRHAPITLPALLPGLLVALHIQTYLFRYLETNHGPGQEGRVFPTLGAANWMTLLRGSAVVGLAGFLPIAFQGGAGLQSSKSLMDWTPGLLYLTISISDLLDGFIARKQGRVTELGKRLDIESDAAGLLVASLLAVAFDRLPAIYLLVGLAYYLFILGIRVRRLRTLPVVALRSRPYARIIAGFQMGLAGMALLPIFHPIYTTLAALVFMTPLLIGFLRDWLVVSCRLQTDINQQSNLDHLAKSLMKKTMPWTFRLAILAGGSSVLIGGDGLSASHFTWQLTLSLCCLLGGVGFMGRSAALLIVLILGWSGSPFGISSATIVLFVSSAALMLSGTGIFSLWTPEEKILYRSGQSL